MSNLKIFPDQEHFVTGAADFICEIAAQAISARGIFTIALSGGSTPSSIYARLAAPGYRARVDWHRVYIFFSDERCVPPEDAQSNFRMANEAWFLPASFPTENIYRIRGEEDPALAALAYEQQIQNFFRAVTCPTFDLILLGMGDNGHTASLFPGTAALRENVRLVVPQYVEVMRSWRVTFTAPLINAARHAAFLVEGARKAQMLWNVMRGPFQPDVLPAQMIQPTHGELHWLVDESAAQLVT